MILCLNAMLLMQHYSLGELVFVKKSWKLRFGTLKSKEYFGLQRPHDTEKL